MNSAPAPSRTDLIAADASLGAELAAKTPFALIAIMIHVVLIAIAALWYVAKEYSTQAETVTEIKVVAATDEPEEVKPPEVIDVELLPNIRDQNIQPSEERNVNPEAEDNPVHGDPDNKDSNVTDLTPGDTEGGSAIGAGRGHYGHAPSAVGGGKLGSGPYGSRVGHGTGLPGPGGQLNYETIIAGLEWLRRHQDEDGHWDTAHFMKHDEGAQCDGPGNAANDVGITGLAMLTFLGTANTLKMGPYRDVVRRGAKWLLENQREDGLFGQPASQEYMYSHAIATLAMCEVYGLSENFRPYKDKCQNALNYIAQARNTYGVWRYQPKDNDSDTSITGWMIQALLSGKEFGLKIDEDAFKAARTWFDSVTDPVTGSSGYQKRSEGSSRKVDLLDKFPQAKSEALTAVVLMCRILMHDEPKEVPSMSKAADTILKKLPTWNATDGSIDMYYWYYGSYAMFQLDGKYWATWRQKLTDACLKTQRKRTEGNFYGSWDPVDAWGSDGGRVYSTAMMVLCLESYFRYSRVLGAR